MASKWDSWIYVCYDKLDVDNNQKVNQKNGIDFVDKVFQGGQNI